MMEKNTYATSTYIATQPKVLFDYLCQLEHLNDWTLGSRMLEQIDADTWLGTASGYQRHLYYHVRRLDHPRFYGIEWHCGYEYDQYFKVYPVLLFPPDYLAPGNSELGTYFHWLSFIDPARRTPMIMEGIHLVHTAEARSLKAILESRAGYREAVLGQHQIQTHSIYINAPLSLAADYLADVRNLKEWGFFIRPQGVVTAEYGEFIDEYGHPVQVSHRASPLSHYALIEMDYAYPELNWLQRCPLILMPCSYAFGHAEAQGCILHRMTFWHQDQQPRHGKLQVEDYGAECMNIKRILEKAAGHLETFGQGMSYEP